MNYLFLVTINDASGVAHRYGVVSASMMAAIAWAQQQAGVSESVEPLSVVKSEKVDAVLS